MAGVSVKNFTRQHLKVLAGLPFAKVAEEILPGWDISLVFVGPKKARELNERLRGKIYTPNVLSYALSEKSGEIFICPREAEKQASLHQIGKQTFILSLFIHGLLHLKGRVHGVTMEKCERKLLTHYGTAHSNWHRHRHVPNKDGRRRRDHR
ncbi:MAG: rRNA maturation RNase YbeY [Minisyncoccia bacterium]|jgi:rRNA maturation RNase YbeY